MAVDLAEVGDHHRNTVHLRRDDADRRPGEEIVGADDPDVVRLDDPGRQADPGHHGGPYRDRQPARRRQRRSEPSRGGGAGEKAHRSQSPRQPTTRILVHGKSLLAKGPTLSSGEDMDVPPAPHQVRDQALQMLGNAAERRGIVADQKNAGTSHHDSRPLQVERSSGIVTSGRRTGAPSTPGSCRPSRCATTPRGADTSPASCGSPSRSSPPDRTPAPARSSPASMA